MIAAVLFCIECLGACLSAKALLSEHTMSAAISQSRPYRESFSDTVISNQASNLLGASVPAHIARVHVRASKYSSRPRHLCPVQAFYAKTLGGDAAKALGLIGEAVTNPRFDAEALEKERDVILREMQVCARSKPTLCA